MPPTASSLIRMPRIWLALALLLSIAVYWTGLHGPFLLDDGTNLGIVQQWLAGQSTFGDVIATRTASPFGRPLAMASLALSAWLGGYEPFAFKLGNLLVHLTCGVVAFALIRRIGLLDARLRAYAGMLAALVVTLWLLHPLQVSTVLYAVQRMAQLSALFVMLGLWMYLVARQRLDRGQSHSALAMLFAGIPLATLAGFLCKENALLLPALCLVLELGCFRDQTRPGPVKAFFALFLATPLVAGLAWFVANPARFMGGYIQRDFDWQQRLLSQARVLCDYFLQGVAPNPSRMGVYTDDFAVSTSLLSPPTTLLAILALLAISIAAWRLRARVPALFVGWGLFLVGHAVESSVLPLELYFEHRNYLPLLGVLYAATGLVTTLLQRLDAAGVRASRIAPVVALGAVLLLAFQTFGRVRVWSDELTLSMSSAAARPASMRAQLAVVDAAIRGNDLALARNALDTLTRSNIPRIRAQGYLNRLNLDCATRHAANPADLAAAVAAAPLRIGDDEAETFDLLFRNTQRPCAGLGNHALAVAAGRFAERAIQPDRFGPKAELRHTAARFHARNGDWPNALQQATLAWQPGMSAAASVILVQAQLATGDIAGAERTYREAAARVDLGDAQDAAGLKWLRGRIDAAGRDKQGPQDGMQDD